MFKPVINHLIIKKTLSHSISNETLSKEKPTVQ